MGADQDIKRLDARLSRMEAAQGTFFRSLSATALPNGVHVTGIETIEVRLDRVITVAPAADGFSVMLDVEGLQTPLPPERARSLAAALIAAAQQVDGEKA